MTSLARMRSSLSPTPLSLIIACENAAKDFAKKQKVVSRDAFAKTIGQIVIENIYKMSQADQLQASQIESIEDLTKYVCHYLYSLGVTFDGAE